MPTEPRLGSGSHKLAPVGTPLEPADRTETGNSSREIDERTAIYLLSLARELLRRDHGAIASMIDYAIAEIETPMDDAD